MDRSTCKNSPAAIEIVGGTIEVTGDLDGRGLINGLWRTISTSSLAQDGDHFMDQSRVVLQRHLKLIPLRDQNVIRESLDLARERRGNMESQSGTSQLRKNLAARDFKRHARKTYKLVRTASARALENILRDQMDEAQRPPGPGDGSGNPAPVPGGGPGSGFGTGTAASDSFGDAHAVYRITDINVNDVARVDMSAYQDEATNDVIGRDRSVKHVVAFAGDRTDMGASAPVPVSSHHDSRPRFIPATIRDVSDQRADEQLETSTLDSFSFDLNEPPPPAATSKGKRPDIIATSIPYVSDQRVDEQGHVETSTFDSIPCE